MAHEFNSSEYANSGTQFLRSVGLMSAIMRTAEKDVREVWFSGLIGEDDLKCLCEMSEAERPILFPGLMFGWEN